MGLTEDDFSVIDFPKGLTTPASHLDIVKPGTIILPPNLLLDGSIDEQCPHFANLVFKAIEGYECDANSSPVRQGIEASCEHLQDDGICGATGGKTCVLSSLSESIHGDVFSDDFEKMAAVFLDMEGKEDISK